MTRASVIVPVFEPGPSIDGLIASLDAQTMPASDFDVVLVDDGSRDDTLVVARAAAAADSRFVVCVQPPSGLVAALRAGLARCRGELVARMDADDVMHDERLAAQHAFLMAHPEIALVATQVELFPADQIQAGYREYVRWQNQCLTPNQIAANIYVESPFAHPSVMLRRDILLGLGGYAEGPFPEDYELWLRMHAAGARMAKLPRTLLLWRERADRTSRIDPRYDRAAFDRLRAREGR